MAITGGLGGVLLRVLVALLRVISPELRRWLGELIRELYQRATATENPNDDVLVESLAGLLGVDLDTS